MDDNLLTIIESQDVLDGKYLSLGPNFTLTFRCMTTSYTMYNTKISAEGDEQVKDVLCHVLHTCSSADDVGYLHSEETVQSVK